MVEVLQARQINLTMGTNIWPWEVDELPNDYLEMMMGLGDLGKYQADRKVMDDAVKRFRAGHPQYGKRR